MIHFYILVGVALIAGVFMIKYLNGNYSYTDKVIEKGDIWSPSKNIIRGQYFIIERTYTSGRIKIIRKVFYV